MLVLIGATPPSASCFSRSNNVVNIIFLTGRCNWDHMMQQPSQLLWSICSQLHETVLHLQEATCSRLVISRFTASPYLKQLCDSSLFLYGIAHLLIAKRRLIAKRSCSCQCAGGIYLVLYLSHIFAWINHPSSWIYLLEMQITWAGTLLYLATSFDLMPSK